MSRLTAMASARSHGKPGKPGSLASKARSAAGRFVGAARGRMGIRGRHRRGHGISKTELRGFRKVVALLRKVGMVPKGTRRAPPRPRA